MSNSKQEKALPPMLRQYLDYKRAHPDCLLFFQVGDFYELFFDDAVVVARVLNLTLTSRDRNSETPVPMCGVPIAVVDGYLTRLVSRNYSVAVVSQQGVAKPGKGMVDRKLERIITPGVRVAGGVEDDGTPTSIASVYTNSEGSASIAYSRVESGIVSIREGVELSKLGTELLRLSPTELILPDQIENRAIDRRLKWVRDLGLAIGDQHLKFRSGEFASAASTRQLATIRGYSVVSSDAQRAVRLLLNYVDEVTIDARLPIRSIEVLHYDHVARIDAVTRDSLELVKNERDHGTEGTLFEFLNETHTVGGARLLRGWIVAPLADAERINNRLECVAELKRESELRNGLRVLIRHLTDLERIAARIELGLVSPRELGAVRDSLRLVPEIQLKLRSVDRDEEALLSCISKTIDFPSDLSTLLEQALADSPPIKIQERGIFRAGFNEELDLIRDAKQGGKSWLVEFELRERARTRIQSLKVKFNNIFGYFIEVTKANLDKVPAEYVRKQSTAQADRFISEELARIATEVVGAGEKELALEAKLYEEFRAKVEPFTPVIRRLAEQLALLDVVLALAEVASRDALVQPIVDSSINFRVVGGRHPILARFHQGQFVPNDLEFGAEARCMLVTGPNMGGKSTFLRQNALIAVMAQIGSFVSAEFAQIGVVDQIFARVGASDNLREGESTFMVEMREAARIVDHATEHSLVLVDEIGRGTATADGLAIAQAILEWLVVTTGCRTLFATHFHELTQLETGYPSLRNLSVGVVDQDGKVVFTHQICTGAADRSYGIEVAQLAGLPENLLRRARAILERKLEQNEQIGELAVARGQLGLFDRAVNGATRPSKVERISPLVNEAVKRIKEQDLNTTTPVEALNLLVSLREKLDDAKT